MKLEHSWPTITTAIGALLNVPTSDPDDARRRKLLNILLLGVGGFSFLAFLAMAFVIAATPTSAPFQEETVLFFVGSLVMLAGIGIIFAVNRYGSGRLASSLFLLFLIVMASVTDEPVQVVDGRGLFLFAIPILMASVILRPYASFIAAGLSSIVIAIIGTSIGFAPNIPAMLGFFVVALVSWLSSRSLEQTLAELRTTNRMLDQRVAERTQDLAEALARVQAESSKNQAILESIADGVIVFDKDGTAMVANSSIAYLLGLASDAIIGRNIENLMRQNVSETDQQMILNFLRGETLTPSVKFRWGDKTLSVSFAAVRDDTETAIGTVAVFRDFTREAELDRMKSAFVSMASHELRTPLNAILGYADMLKEAVYGPLADEQRNIMERIIANTKRMLGLVNNLLDQAQIESGRLVLHVTSFSPTDLLNELDAVMRVLVESKGLRFSCSIDDDVPNILYGDPQRLHQILVNLVSNATKFTEWGEVRVHIHRLDESHWALEVSDTGSGIPQEAHAYIFEPFRQVEDQITRRHAGSGLGLSIVKQLTALMGGDVHLKSAEGQGSTFTVVLPLTPVQEKAA